MSIGKKVLIGFGVLIFILFLSNLGKDGKKQSTKTSNETTSQKISETIADVEILKHDAIYEETMEFTQFIKQALNSLVSNLLNNPFRMSCDGIPFLKGKNFRNQSIFSSPKQSISFHWVKPLIMALMF
jgi:hypothetical protein